MIPWPLAQEAEARDSLRPLLLCGGDGGGHLVRLPSCHVGRGAPPQ